MVLGISLSGGSASAVVEGAVPLKVGNWRLFGAHSATGAALMVAGPYQAEINSVLLPQSSSQLGELPYDAEVVAAFLFWSGSSPRTDRVGAPDPPDRDVDLTLPDGTFYNDLSVDDDPVFGACRTTAGLGGFYYCRREITDEVAALGPGNANGIYTVGDLRADPGTLSSSDPQWINAQGKYAGWSIIIVWRGTSSQNVRRDVVLYDGFLRLDETTDSLSGPGIHAFTIGDFLVGSPALGKLSVFGMEGDRQLGVPPQDATGCPTCYDFISFRSNSAAAATKLSNGLNPANNSFNSSTDTSIDIDTYYLDGLIRTADASAQITLGSGDGVVEPYNQGNGESFFVGWVIMTIDTLTPNFGGTQTRKTVVPTEAGPGQALYYIIDVVNEGSLNATGVVVQDSIPAGTTYVAGSTRVDGVPRADVGGTSPLVAGLGIGTIPTSQSGDNSRQITFAVQVEANACGGQVSNTALVDSAQTDPVDVGPAVTTVAIPTLDPPTKRVSFISPAPYGPGAAFSYTIDVVNAGDEPAAGVQIDDRLPEHMVIASVFASSGDVTLTGRDLVVTNISVAAQSSAQVVITGRVRTVAEFAAAGVSENAIDGLVVSNQATVSGGCTPAQLTDDPDLPGFQSTDFALTYAPSLATSSKSGTDLNGGRLEPLDLVEYRITVANTGNRPAEVIVRDAMPAHTAYVAGSTRVDGAAVADSGGDSPLVGGLSLGVLTFLGAGDHDRVITFRVQVDTDVANGAVVQNRADLEVPVFPAADRTVLSAPLTVFAAPAWQTSTKAVADDTPPLGVYEPGDLITYTVTIVNTGNRAGTGVAVADTLSPSLTFVAASDGGALVGNQVRWALGAIPAGGTRAVTVQARIVTPLDHGTVVTNQAVITCDQVPPFTTPPVSFTVSSSPRLVVEKVFVPVHPSPPVAPGASVAYRITVRNLGTMVARGVVLTDPIDAALSGATAIGGSLSGGVARWSLGDLAPGGPAAVRELTASVRFPLANGTIIANQATATPDGFPPVVSDDPATAAPLDPTRVTVVAQATLLATKVVEDLSPATPYQPGDRVRYTLLLTAGGDAPLRDLELTDPVDLSLTAVDASSSGGSVSGGVVTWSATTGAPALAELEPGESVELTVEATIAAGTADGTVVANQATAVSADLAAPVLTDDPGTPAAADPTRFTVVSKPLLVVSKTVALFNDDDPEFNPGDEVAYTITVRNTGTAPATGVQVVDPLDGNLTLTAPDGASVSGQVLTWTFAEPLAAGGERVLRPRARIAFPLDDGTRVRNQARVSSAELPDVLSDDPGVGGAVDPTDFIVRARPVFETTTKSVRDLTGDPLITRPGDQLEYTLAVRNSGDADATQVVVRDPLPADVQLGASGGARLDGGALVWDAAELPALARLAAGGEVVLVFSVTVDSPLANGTRIVNQATVRSAEVATPAPSDDPATVASDDPTVVTVVSASDLGASTKVVTDLGGAAIATARPRDVVRYVIGVANRGDAPARNVVVQDPLPPTLELVEAPGATYDAGARTLRWEASAVPALAEVLPGAPAVTLAFTARLAWPLDNGLVVANQGALTEEGAASPVLTDADLATLPREETVLTVVSSPLLDSSTKVFVSPATGQAITSARPGEAVRMLITVVNTGDAVARGVVIEDAIDTALLTNVVARDGGSFAGGVARWTGLEVSPLPGGELVVRVDARLRSPLDPTVLVNQALIGVGAPATIPSDDPRTPAADDPTRLTVDSAARFVRSTKDVPALPGREVEPGQLLAYVLVVHNDGDGNARNVVVTDVLAPELEFVAASCGTCYDAGTRTVTWLLPLVPGGTSTTLTLSARVRPLLADGTAILNQGRIVADGGLLELTDDPQNPTADAPTAVTVRAAPSFALFSKAVTNLDEAEPGMLRPGDRLEYTLRLRNDGNTFATEVVVIDKIAATLTDVEPVSACDFDGAALRCDQDGIAALASVAPGDEVTLTFRARVAAGLADGTEVINQAELAALELAEVVASDDPATAAAGDPTVLRVRYPDLVSEKAAVDVDGGDVEPNDLLRFSIRVHNRGSFTARGVVVTDDVRDFAGVGEVSDGGSLVGPLITWSLGDLAAGAERVVSFTGRVPASAIHGTILRNRAQVSAALVPARESNLVELVVVAIPRLDEAVKVVVPDRREVAPGDLVTYRIEVPNRGSAVATGLQITDPISPWLEVRAIRGGGTLAGESVVWQRAQLAIDETWGVEVDVRVRDEAPNGALILNQAGVAASELTADVLTDDPRTAEIDDPTTLEVRAQAALSSSTLTVLDLDGGVVLPGDRLRFELRVRNDGTTAAREVAARLPAPAYLNYRVGSTILNGAPVADAAGGSPLSDGMSVRSARAGTEPGVVWRDDGAAPADEDAVVAFEVTVDPRAMPGTVIRAQASLSAREAEPALSDNPATGQPGDPTVVVVGGGGYLAVGKAAQLELDVDGDGRFDVGDTVRYRLTIVNAGDGAAFAAELGDRLPAEVDFVAGSLRLDGTPLTDAEGDDAGEVVDGGAVRVRLGDLAPGGGREVTLAARVVAGPVIVNQATVSAGGRSYASDGDPALPGEQPTSIVVGAQPYVGLALEAVDRSGGVVEAGDEVEWVLVARNQGAAPLTDVQLVVLQPTASAPAVITASGAAEVESEAPPTWRLGRLAPGEQVRLACTATVEEQAAPGTAVEAVGRLEIDGASFTTEPVRLLVGGGAGSAAVRGKVFRDLGARASETGGFAANEDVPLRGFSVLLIPEERLADAGRDGGFDSLAVRAVVSATDGAYIIPGVPVGRYRLWAASPEGTVFVESAALELASGESGGVDLAIDPSGIIYEVAGGTAFPVAGARVFLTDAGTGVDLPRTELLGGQQGQVTTGQGFYRFDVRQSSLPGRFVLRVEPPAATMVFPSVEFPAVGASAADPFGEAAPGGAVAGDTPDPQQGATYYLRFDLQPTTAPVTNNHVPLDRLAQHIRVTKQASRRTASIGELVTYSVRIENPLDLGLLVDPLGGGGVQLVDDLPRGIRWGNSGVTISTALGGAVGEARSLGVRGDPQQSGVVRFDNFSLPARSVVTVRYVGVVSLTARGEQVNRARLIEPGGGLISNEASATVRVVEDPLFSQGTILGRVFCDGGDGGVGAEDPGLPGARVYLDTGYYVDTDVDGKFHFRGVPAGRHVIKLDLNTVPPGSEPTTTALRDFYSSPALLTKVSFGLRCALDAVRPSHVLLKEAPPAPPKPTVVVMVDPTQPAIALDGRVQPLPLVDAVVSRAGEEPDFASGVGLNLEAPAALTWHIQSPSRTPIAGWQISVFDADGAEVWRLAGSGRPPARVPWELAAEAPVLTPGVTYVYRIAARTADGDLGEGRWRRLGLRVGEAAQVGADAPRGPATIWSGKLFKNGSDTPEPALRERVAAWVPSLVGDGLVVVEAHVTHSRQRSANLLLSQRRALAVKDLLVAAGVAADRIKAQGKGDTEPLMPNVTRKARERNERVVLRLEQAVAVLAALPPLAYAARLEVGGKQAPPAERGEWTLEVDAGESVVVDLRRANGARVRVERPFPFADVGTAAPASIEVPISGNLGAGRVSFFEATVDLPLLAAECGLANGPLQLGATGLSPPARFTVKAAAPLRSWLVRILNPDGSVLRDLSGDGEPPATVEWGGLSPSGAVVVKPGLYAFRCLLTDVDGNRAVSSRRVVPVGVETGKPVYTRVLRGELYPEAGALQRPVLEELDRLAQAVAANPGASVRLEVHDNATGGKLQAQIRSARLGEVLKAALAMRGLGGESLELLALGATRPVMAGSSRRALTENRRVLIEVLPPQATMALGEATPARIKVGGKELPLDGELGFAGTVVLGPDAVVGIEAAKGDGAAVVYAVPTFAGRPLAATGGAVLPGLRPAPTDGAPMGSLPATLLEEPMPGGGSAPSFADSLRGAAVVDAIVGFVPGMPAAALTAPSGPPPLVPPSGAPVLVAPSGPPSEALVAAAGSPALAGGVRLAAADAPPTSALDLRVWLPADGATLRGERLTVRGRCDVQNQVRVNGEEVPIDELGRFVKVLTLPAGDASVTVEATDAAGNVAQLARSYRVPGGEWFLLAMADTAVGWGTRLEGMNEDTTIEAARSYAPEGWPQELYLHGRAVAYFKGRVKGDRLFSANPFAEVRVTAHVDTGKPRDADVLKQLIDPERYYPVYGDAAEEVQDVATRHKVYVLLQADQSRLVVGNFKSELQGLELFRFQRSFFGAALDIDHAFVAGQRTEIHALAASGEQGLRHRQISMQGTGGAMFFLRDGELVEGSERVELVVRDAVTGARLFALPQVRDLDYTLSYREGRLIFSRPIPSVVGGGFRLNQNPVSTLEGHKLFVEVEYDFAATTVLEGERAFAFQARQSFFDRVTAGFGIVDEDRREAGGTHYQLIAGEARVKLLPRTELSVEVAHSQAEDAEHLVSFDGGVTFGRVGGPLWRTGADGGLVAVNPSGWAAKVQLSGDVGEVLDALAIADPRGASPELERLGFVPYALYVAHQDSGFYSGSSVLEQGQTKVGGQLRVVLSPEDSLRLRHDGIWSELFLGEAATPRQVNRQLTVVGYERTEKAWRAGVEVGNTYWDDGERVVNTEGVTGYGELKLSPRLTGLAEQEVLFGGDRRVLEGWGDQLVTTVGGRYALAEWLTLTATESVRWSGTNSTQVGLRSQVSDALSFYAAERFVAGGDQSVSTTVVGGESTAIPGSRSYAEYQLDALASGQSGRAVFGMDNRWTLIEGLRLNLAYERSQLLGDAGGGLVVGDQGYAVGDRNVSGYGASALRRDQQFSASGYSSAGVFPTGLSSRDAFSIGLDYVRRTTLKAGARFELRYDRVDDNLGAPDRLVLFGQAGGDWRLDRNLVALMRLRGATVQNLDAALELGNTYGFAEGQFLDISVGLALRPVDSDRVEGLFKWTRRLERLPVTENLTQFQLETSDVVSLEPAVELGYGVQAVGKLALKLSALDDADLPPIRSTTILALVRLNYHLRTWLDAGVEYRWLTNLLTEETMHGALCELAWIPVEYVAVGVGYNFTHFSDDLLAPVGHDPHGFFLRVTGRF